MQRIETLINRIKLSLFGQTFYFKVAYDERDSRPTARIYIQIKYTAKCEKTGAIDEWGGRKWYLSEFMTDDEIIKTTWCAYEAVVKHELMETFKVDGITLFNPHVNFEELLLISHKEVTRK